MSSFEMSPILQSLRKAFPPIGKELSGGVRKGDLGMFVQRFDVSNDGDILLTVEVIGL